MSRAKKSNGDSDMPEFPPERHKLVLEMVDKLLRSVISGLRRDHFRAYAPPEIRANPSIPEKGILKQLRDTVWWIRWYDEKFDQLQFHELIIFLHLYSDMKQRMQDAANRNLDSIEIDSQFAIKNILTDDNMRRILARLVIEPDAPPPPASN